MNLGNTRLKKTQAEPGNQIEAPDEWAETCLSNVSSMKCACVGNDNSKNRVYYVRY